MSRPTVALVGLDTRDGQLWTWRWHDQEHWNALHVVDPKSTWRLRILLAATLPGRVPPTAGQADAHPLGPLAMRDTEWLFSAEVARLLLPKSLRAEVRRRADAEGRVLFRVFPSPSAAAVPWELLPVGAADEELRLLDVADIVHIAPLLPRDTHPEPGQSTWRDVAGRPPLHVVDPLVGGVPRVLSDAALVAWRAARPGLTPRRGRAVVSAFGDHVDRWWLARQLPGRSRLMYVGHVGAAHADTQSTGLLLGCQRFDYSADERPIGTLHRYFTARDAIRGTLDHAELTGDPARALALFGVPRPHVGPAPGVPLDGDGRPGAVAGRDIWPMPPRVALIGCRSGSDPSHAEPFGLVTALLHAGAELVTATRWTIHTGKTFNRWGSPGDPLDVAAHAVDAVQQLDDPVAGLGDWQRARLASWRSEGRLLDTPLVWAALATFDGHPRTTA